MAQHMIGTGCNDCLDGVCTMNCSSAVLATGTDWIAASIWSGTFPQKATAEQVRAWQRSRARQ
jgi:hypothetical protein